MSVMEQASQLDENLRGHHAVVSSFMLNLLHMIFEMMRVHNYTILACAINHDVGGLALAYQYVELEFAVSNC